jgi:dTDP-4-amino-4,6-dideoxy-D-galactose acyltransferase
MYNIHQLLNWDTHFFGYKIAAIHTLNLKLNELDKIITELKELEYKLAYCFVNPDDEISNSSLKSVSGLLGDKKITFSLGIDNVDNFTSCIFIKPYSLNFANEKLKSLALQSGIYSRYKTDPNFENNEFERLYIEWIEKSVKRIIAKEVLVYYENEDEKGLITLGLKKNTGSIGLFAVDEKERGKSIGKKLVQQALLYFKKIKTETIEVVTQADNINACGFYRSMGFETKSIVNIYHLWIN